MISVVICTHSAKISELEQTLFFLKEQWQPDYELIIVSQDPIPNYFGKIVVINAEFNKGKMCNIGVGQTKHKRVLLLDDDRIVPANFLNKALEKGFIAPRFLVQLDKKYSNEEIRQSKFECSPQFRSIANELHRENLFSGCIAFDKTDYFELGGMYEGYSGRSPSDADMTQKVIESGKSITYTNDVEIHLYHSRKPEVLNTIYNGLDYLKKWNISPSQKFVDTCRHNGILIDTDFDEQSCGIVTACTQDYFQGFKLLYETLRYFDDYPITCVDLGLDADSLDWCKKNNVKVLTMKHFVLPQMFDKWEKYTIWIKPYLIGGYRYTLWLDSDVIVIDSLKEAFEKIKEKPFLIRHDPQFYERAVNNYQLYKISNKPVPPINHKRVNAGVCGFDIIRDNYILQLWRKMVNNCQIDEGIRSLVHYQDQGCLNYVLQTNYLDHLINDDCVKWNKFYDMETYHYLGGKLASILHKHDIEKCISLLQNEYKHTNLLHWAGPSKIWHFKKHFKMV